MIAPPFRTPLVLATVALGVVWPGTASACTRAVRAEIVRRAITLMPPSLARQLKRHDKALYAAALADIADPPAPVAALDPGRADADLAAAVASVGRLLEQRASMDAVARAFGDVARLSADLSFALNIGPADPRATSIYPAFCRYVEQKLPKITMTFPGYSDPELARDDVPAFARRTAAAARRDYDGILASWFPPGRRAVAEDFDDRSVAFGSASVEVSLALTTTARAWLYAWNAAGGDLGGTPFLTSP